MWEPKWFGLGSWLNSYRQDHMLFLLLPSWKLPRKAHSWGSHQLFLFCLSPHWDPAPTSTLLSGTCPLHFSVGTKWPGPTHPALTEEETKHRHILHVCMAHRESLPSHLCGLISLFLSLPFCVFLFTHSVAAWKCSTCGESLSPVHMLGERTRLGWDWQSQTKCLRNTQWLPYATLCHTHPDWGTRSTRWGWADLYPAINLFLFSFQTHHIAASSCQNNILQYPKLSLHF